MSPAVPPARSPREPLAARFRRSTDLSVTLAMPGSVQDARRGSAAAAGPGRSAAQHLVPNLLIAGVTHSGAADLASALGRHPEIKLPAPRRIDHYTVMRYGRAVEGSLDDYDRYFSAWSGQRYRLENSPVYFDGGRDLVETVVRDLPGARVLLLLRDPGERLWTSYRDKVARGRLPRAMTYETFVERCLALRANGSDRFEGNRHFRTLSSGFYVEFLDQWLSAFGSRARVVFAEDVDIAPTATVDGVLDWLGLDPALSPYEGLLDAGSAGAPTGLESFEPDPGRRLWGALPGARRSLDGPSGLVRRVTRARVPRQNDRVRSRVDTLYAGANRELAAVLRHRGYSRLPEWLDEV